MGNIKEVELNSNEDYPNLIKIIRLKNFKDFPYKEFEYHIIQKNEDISKEIVFYALNEKNGRLVIGISDCGGHASAFARNDELASFIEKLREANNTKMIRHHDAGWTISDMETLDYVVQKIIESMTGKFSFSFKMQWKNDYRMEFLTSLFCDYQKKSKIEEMITKYIREGDTKIIIGENQKFYLLTDKDGGLFSYSNRLL